MFFCIFVKNSLVENSIEPVRGVIFIFVTQAQINK